ncbi:MAG TPA: DUF222 domain-containing protein [Candidatus Lustribacter sp.]|nr:DUF222 domain-containing protein [Candidatus Lustribacter sp.]
MSTLAEGTDTHPGGLGEWDWMDPFELLVEVPGTIDPRVREALVTVAGAGGPGALVGRDAAQALSVVEAVEAVKAWAEHVGLEAWARLREATHEDAEADPAVVHGMWGDGSGGLSHEARRELDSCVVDEVALATGLGPVECHSRFRFATAEPARTATLRARMAAGRTGWWQARRVMEACQGMPDAVADQVAARVLAPARDGSLASSGTVSRRLARQVTLHDPHAGERRRGEAFLRRDARVTLEDDGTGTLVITTTAARAVQAVERLDAAARAQRCAGDPRTLGQLRSDIATSLLSAGTLTGSTGAIDESPDGAEGAPDSSQDNGPDGTGQREVSGPAWYLPPPARVNVVVALSTLLGLDEQAGEIPGHGFLTAAHTRQVALAAGSIWRRLVVDDLSGHAIEVSTHRYRPSEEMRTQVAARDGTCRGPGCTIPAAGCDLDHQRPWPQGPTSIDNLNAKHRAHHNRKTRSLWRCDQDLPSDEVPEGSLPLDARERPGGAIRWTTRARRRYTTYPAQYLHPDYDPLRE